MDIKSQEEKILSWLKRGKKITALDALKRFKCLRLSARIRHLRKQNYKIRTELVERGGKWVAEYSL